MAHKPYMVRRVVSTTALAFINNFWMFLGGQILCFAAVVASILAAAASFFALSAVGVVLKSLYGLPMNDISVFVPSFGMHTVIGVVGALAFLILAVTVGTGFMAVSLKALRNQPIAFSDYFSQVSKLPQAFVASIMLVFGLFIGSLLLVVPGVYFITRYGLALYYIVDEDAGVMEAFRKSSALTHGKRLRVFGALFILAFVGNIVRLVGFSLSWIGGASLYEELRKEQA